MVINESIVVEHNSKLHNVIHRGFVFDKKALVWFYRKDNRKRYDVHSTKCFDHAHHLFRKLLAENNMTWETWHIKMVGTVSNGDFYSNRVNFQFMRTK